MIEAATSCTARLKNCQQCPNRAVAGSNSSSSSAVMEQCAYVEIAMHNVPLVQVCQAVCCIQQEPQQAHLQSQQFSPPAAAAAAAHRQLAINLLSSCVWDHLPLQHHVCCRRA
jgi:hypothetical protein